LNEVSAYPRLALSSSARGSQLAGGSHGHPEMVGYLRAREPLKVVQLIFGGDSPRALARRIWQRRITKASLERSPASSRSRSFSDSSRAKIGGFMEATIAHHTQPSLRMH
jgi:hypothetical protein